MDFCQLIKSTRLGCEEASETEELSSRSEFKRDFDRILFSPAFRRLQGKTQVFPFPDNDHIHNRLTHSLEVYSIARSIGTLCANRLDEKGDLLETVGDIVGSKCQMLCMKTHLMYLSSCL